MPGGMEPAVDGAPAEGPLQTPHAHPLPQPLEFVSVLGGGSTLRAGVPPRGGAWAPALCVRSLQARGFRVGRWCGGKASRAPSTVRGDRPGRHGWPRGPVPWTRGSVF